MDRYEKVKKIEDLQKLQKNIQKLLDEDQSNSVIFQKLLNDIQTDLEKSLIPELPILICTSYTENDIQFVYYLGDLDRIRMTDEILPNTLDFEGKLNCPYDMLKIVNTQKYLNSLISEIIKKSNVNNWMGVGILLETELNERQNKR